MKCKNRVRSALSQKRILCEVFTMAQVSSSTWAAFMEVNRLYEIGKLKGQKFSPGDVVKGTLAIKQWHMKPLVSLPDETKLFLLNKISSGELLLKDLKTEADKIKTLNTVQFTVMSFFKVDDWDEIVKGFGPMVNNEKLLRFTGNFEASYDFQVFLKRLKEWESARHEAAEDTPVATLGVEEFTVSNEGLHNKGSAVFPCNLQEVTQSMEIFKLNFEGISLALGVVGFDDKGQLEVEEKCSEIVKLLSRLNFTVLSSFNCVIMCPVHWAHIVSETFTKEGASQTQQGFIYHKQQLKSRQGSKMQEVVSSFIVGHWASSRIVGKSHVNYATPPPNIVEVTSARIGEEYPVSFFKDIISWFSKDGDLILEVGYGDEVGNAFTAALMCGRKATLTGTSCDKRIICQKLSTSTQLTTTQID
mmetsp:Transcript_36100/g.57708  ORF Transcript_36100/g.57708 Transcript_36100/m.57708 type:complete len:417 (+) Transcript_36100:589-1839(+)